MPLQTIITGFILGLSASPACLGVCLPVLLPHIGVAGRENPLRAGLTTSLFFALGRLIIYLGLAIGLFIIGASLGDYGLWNWVGSNTPWIVVSRILLAMLIMLYGITVVFDWPRFNWCQTLFHGQRQQPFLSLLLGMLAGSVLCPALWLAFLQAMRSAWLPEAGLSILSFWVGSSLIVVAVGISTGAILRRWHNITQVRGIAGATLIFVGALYLL